ncbi:MAG: DNA-formamidopyrimidine glycosylase [Dehalococcoidia bacterium]|nr:DNA-formamidopyrimidine glycosylase [Dehalococcoidia bacterium]
MPELPEVETVKNEIAPHVLGRTIKGVTLLWEGIVKETPVKEFLDRVTGRVVTAIHRHGKYLLFNLDSGDSLVVHLKMTGSLFAGASEPPQYTRAIIQLENGQNIYFRDPRKFGVLKVVQDSNVIESKLGPEPLEKEFTVRIFAERLKGRKAPIKALLLDQKFLAGVGNMYADEALFASRIHPERISGSLTADEVKRLHKAIREVLKAAIIKKGASIVTYYRPDGSKGTAQTEFNVAHGQVEKCHVCGTPIKRIVVRGRGTYFCPKCQPAAGGKL